MPAAKHPLVIEQGATFSVDFRLTNAADGLPYDPPPGSEVRMQIRPKQGGKVMVEATNGNGMITLSQGVLSVEIPASVTTMFAIANAAYDVEVAHGDKVVRLVEGKVKVSPNITQGPGEPVVR